MENILCEVLNNPVFILVVSLIVYVSTVVYLLVRLNKKLIEGPNYMSHYMSVYDDMHEQDLIKEREFLIKQYNNTLQIINDTTYNAALVGLTHNDCKVLSRISERLQYISIIIL